MTQSRLRSATEAVTNVVVGFVLSAMVTAIVFPMFGYPIRLADNLAISAIFTVVSILRSYALRRLFNHLDGRPA